VIKRLRQRPRQARLLGSPKIVADRATGDTRRLSDLAVTELRRPLEAEHVMDLAHGYSFGGHRGLVVMEQTAHDRPWRLSRREQNIQRRSAGWPASVVTNDLGHYYDSPAKSGRLRS
jgi:hypothetical protein